MKLLAKAGDTNAPNEIFNLRIYVAAICASCAAIMIGYDSAFFGTSISLTSFRTEFGWNKKSASSLSNLSANIVSIYQAGAFFGALSVYPVAFLFGRKLGLMCAAAVTTVGCGIMLAANGARGDWPIFAGRAIAGFGVGQASSMAPLYLSEISPAQIRGQLIGFYEIGWQIGGLVGFWINYAVQKNLPVGHTQWFIPFAVQLIPAGLFLILVPVACKESPRWLLSKGKRELAIKNLCYLRKLDENHPYLIQEVNDISIQVDQDNASVGTGFFGPIRAIFSEWRLSKRLLLTTSLFIFQNGTGINAVNYYSPTFFKSIGVTGERAPLLTTGVFGVIKTLGALAWAFYWIDKYGRKAVLIVGSIGGAVGMGVIGIILGVTDPVHHPRPAGSGLPASGGAAIAFFYIWTAFYAIGWNGTPWVVNSESFPGAVRLVCSLFAAASNWLWNFVIARSTPKMFSSMGHSGFGVYLFFAAMQIVSIFYVFFLIPETKGIPLEAMDALWEHPKPRLANRDVSEQVANDRSQRQNDEGYLKPEVGYVEQSKRSSMAREEDKIDMNVHP